jgi:sugar phosphate isomerase/epimerase
MALAALPFSLKAAKIDSRLRGVQLGVHTYSFSGLPHDGILDVIINCMVGAGIGECILLAAQLEPAEFLALPGASVSQAQTQAREKWRLSTPLDYFKPIRKKFESAGIEIYGFSATPGPSDDEANRIFEIARVLGAKFLTIGGTLALAKRLAPIATQHKMIVALQGHPNISAAGTGQISTPADYEEVLSLSRNFWISLDIGDATGGGYDALQFVQAHHDRIHSIFLKDRRKDRVSLPWGEGDTPIKPILQLIRDRKYPIRCYVDCDYKSAGNRPDDVKRCFEYAKAALAHG